MIPHAALFAIAVVLVVAVLPILFVLAVLAVERKLDRLFDAEFPMFAAWRKTHGTIADLPKFPPYDPSRDRTLPGKARIRARRQKGARL